MSYLLLFSLCASINNFDPPGKKYDLSAYQKKTACKLAPHIEESANKNSLDPYIFTALIIVESGFDSKAVSSAGACGLTQVIPRYTGGPATLKKKYTCRELFKPKTSIRVGTQILSWWVEYRKGDIRSALCSYNAGFPGCRRAARYAKKVLLLAHHLRIAN